MDERIKSISFWMKSKNILVPENWIRACVEWLEASNEQSIINQEKLNILAYEQWLLTDLKDLDRRVLPEEVKNEKFLLKGTYSLQIDLVVDVSLPKQTQLNHLLNKHNENDLVCAETQTTQKSWESKPTRMLTIGLTDGVLSVTGMEYHPIPQLSTNTIPGTKICVRGPIICRNGVLFLEQKNIEVLGGEVETLMERNSYAAVLFRDLGLPTSSIALASTEDVEPDISDEELARIVSTDVKFENGGAGMPSPEGKQLGSGSGDTWDEDLEDDFDELALHLMDVKDQETFTPNDDFINQSTVQNTNSSDPLPDCLRGAKFILSNEQSSHRKIILNIKVIIITLRSMLKSDTEHGWSLRATICDGTDVLDVEFSNGVLEKLIGLTVKEADVLKKDAQSKILWKDRLEKCKKLIINFCHFMTVEMTDEGQDQIVGEVVDIEM